jgi:hypothetical protein
MDREVAAVEFARVLFRNGVEEAVAAFFDLMARAKGQRHVGAPETAV